MAPPLIMSAINRGKRGKKSTRARVRSAMKHARKRARSSVSGRFQKARIHKAEKHRLGAHARKARSNAGHVKGQTRKSERGLSLKERAHRRTVRAVLKKVRRPIGNSGHTRFYGSGETTAAEREHMRRLKAISDAVMAATKNPRKKTAAMLRDFEQERLRLRRKKRKHLLFYQLQAAKGKPKKRALRAGATMAKRGKKKSSKRLQGKAFVRRMNRAKKAKAEQEARKRRRKRPARRRGRARRNSPASAAAWGQRAYTGKSSRGGALRRRKKRGKRSTAIARRAPGRHKRRASGKQMAAITRLSNKLRKLEGRRRGGLKRRKSGGSRMTPAKSRIGALKAKRHFMKGGRGFSPAASKYLRIHGFSKINRGNKMHVVKHGMDSIPTLLTHALVATVGWGSMTALGNWAGAQLAQKFWGGQYAAVLKPAVTALGTAAGFIGLRMYGKTAQYSGLFAIGGIIGIVHNAIANAPTVTTATGEMKLSELLMLPIGSTLIPGVDLGPVDKRLHGYESPRKFLGAYANSGNRKDFSGYVQREAFEGPSAAPEQQLKREATLRRMKELQGKDAGGNRDAV